MGTRHPPTHPRRRRSGARCPVGLLVLEIPDGAGKNGAYGEPALSGATATRSRLAAAGKGRRSALPNAGSAEPGPPAQRAPQTPSSAVAIRSTGLGSSSQRGIDRQGEFV